MKIDIMCAVGLCGCSDFARLRSDGPNVPAIGLILPDKWSVIFSPEGSSITTSPSLVFRCPKHGFGTDSVPGDKDHD